MATLYTDSEPYVCEWARNLIDSHLVSSGDVLCKDIREIEPHDLEGYERVHFFSGIAGWDYALQLAGWPEDREVWTGSCPCQPFSSAGKRRGTDDERHLWPEMLRLIEGRMPEVVFGEQVSGKAGERWLCGVWDDLEEIGYRCSASSAPAASVGAPFAGERLYWVAQTNGAGDAHKEREDAACSSCEVPGKARERERLWSDPWERGHDSLGNDGRRRRVEPGIPLLADGFPERVAQVRAYGNAIVPQVAAEFIAAFLETESCV